LCSSLTLPNNLFFTQIIKQSINYVFSSIIHDCLPTFGQVFNPTLEEIRRFGCEEVVEAILELSVIVERNSKQGPESRADVEESPSRVPEWPLLSCLQCAVGHCHAEESLHVIDPCIFAGLLPQEREVVENSVQQ
jgi:hypothetical protein